MGITTVYIVLISSNSLSIERRSHNTRHTFVRGRTLHLDTAGLLWCWNHDNRSNPFDAGNNKVTEGINN